MLISNCEQRRYSIAATNIVISCLRTVLLVAVIGILQADNCKAVADFFANEFDENDDNANEQSTPPPVFRDCGGILKESQQGIIATPHFPKVFPYPISCKWVIEAPVGKAIFLYLTQFYLKDGLRATEYAYYHSDTIFAGRKDLGMISCESNITFLLTKKPVLVLELDIREITNIHLRVMNHVLDVFGFNITYEIVGKDASGAIRPRPDVCSALQCTFNGECLVSKNFERYYCSCYAVGNVLFLS